MLTRREWLALPAAAAATYGQQPPPRTRRRRGECFFGIHFDLHPSATDTELGKDLSEANIADFLDRVRPDFVQYDAKGHNGWLAWPSQVSPSSPGIIKDSLPVWRKLTAQRGIPLYIHFSGVWDSLAVQQHPEWARLDAEGKRDERQTSLWSAYAEQRMIPQLLEAAGKYNLDGAWVDGECWQTNPDYHPNAIRAWLQMGLGADAPKKPGDPHWEVWLEFQREKFRAYLRNYATKLKAAYPDFEVCSNWMYSTFVPEKPDLPLDFISGDYLGNAALSRARLEARYIAEASRASGKPWDLMAWGFQQGNSNPVGHVHKPPEQLKQEAGVVLAQGGGFQVYYQPTRAGRIDERHIAVMAEVAGHCRERRALCHKSESLSEAAVLFSKHSLYKHGGKLFGGWGSQLAPAVGLLDALIANHISVDVYPDWSQNRWPKLAVPDWTDIGAQLAQDLVEQVKSGLGLLLCGAQNARLFAPFIGYQLDGDAREVQTWIATDKLFVNAKGLWQNVKPGQGRVLANWHETYDSQRPGNPAALVYQLGKGKVVLVPGPIGYIYDATHAAQLRDFIGLCWRELGPLQIELEDQRVPVEAVLRKISGVTVLHLLNYSNQQVAGTYTTVDYVPPVPPQKVRVRLNSRPQSVIWEPGSQKLPFTYQNGVCEFTAPSLHLHGMVRFA